MTEITQRRIGLVAVFALFIVGTGFLPNFMPLDVAAGLSALVGVLVGYFLVARWV